jgi:recombinational DNA repair protein RecR
MKKRHSLTSIPGIGPKAAQDLNNLGIYSVAQLKNKDPEKLYNQLCEFEHQKIDRCVLYVLRCAVYFASHDQHDPELLKWWHWKDNLSTTHK